MPDEQLELRGVRPSRENEIVLAFLQARKLARQAGLPTMCGLDGTRQRYWEHHLLHRPKHHGLFQDYAMDAQSSNGEDWQDASPPSAQFKSLPPSSPLPHLLSSSPGRVSFERSSTLVSPVVQQEGAHTVRLVIAAIDPVVDEWKKEDGPDGTSWTCLESKKK